MSSYTRNMEVFQCDGCVKRAEAEVAPFNLPNGWIEMKGEYDNKHNSSSTSSFNYHIHACSQACLIAALKNEGII